MGSTTNEDDRLVPSVDAIPELDPPNMPSYPITVQSTSPFVDNERSSVAEIELSSDEDTREQTQLNSPSDELTLINQSSDVLPTATQSSDSDEVQVDVQPAEPSMDGQSTSDTYTFAQEQTITWWVHCLHTLTHTLRTVL